ncbi:MAG: DUF2461 domain-containing protein [Flavobacteriales bacterium]|jgi:uncharacterized protein (TIGR02453 family)|nr:DUF2461 domain-containing protein [Flavobacteriales bacterium]MDO7583522.1 DUF2461 domain-containing protein [Schleiferiaceae bacterium]MDO7660718.1 DUF2461 domain-containing protein [Schleiferiaceae bacterium]MDO7691035.1 DUF2461 domain-containing protein [Schleiferiaceae bacterium]
MNSINPQVFEFFNRLSENNNREWFEQHKPEFKNLELGVKEFGSHLFDQISAHDSLERWKLMRIYRDVRFSKNKTPYKTNFGISFRRTQPSSRGSYYLHISPEDCFLACGFWGPEPADLLRIRKELAVSADEFREILNRPSFRDTWGDLVGEELKSAPRGFDKQHPAIDLIRKKQFLFLVRFSDQEITEDDFSSRVNLALKDVRPFVDFMSDVLTTDLNGEPLV